MYSQCPVLQLRIQLIKRGTACPTVQLHVLTFRQGKAIKNDIMTTAYHDVVTTWYLLLYSEYFKASFSFHKLVPKFIQMITLYTKFVVVHHFHHDLLH